MSAFQRPRTGYTSVLGKGPEVFSFDGDNAVIPATENDAQNLVNYFKTYLTMATQQCAAERVAAAKEAERKEDQRLEAARQKAEERQRVLEKLKI